MSVFLNLSGDADFPFMSCFCSSLEVKSMMKKTCNLTVIQHTRVECTQLANSFGTNCGPKCIIKGFYCHYEYHFDTAAL